MLKIKKINKSLEVEGRLGVGREDSTVDKLGSDASFPFSFTFYFFLGLIIVIII